MNRRQFLQVSAAGLAASALTNYSRAWADTPHQRVAIIGPGWYGKCDLLRLIQVAPVEVVALCDVDQRMRAQAADIVATRQLSHKKPLLYGDYRKMLKEQPLDIVLVDTPDHWHALAMIAAVQAGADVWVQKPISKDILEGQAMLAAARRHGRVVQVGLQRRSTPHLIEALDRVIKPGLLGRIAHVEICCYYHMRASGNPPDIDPPPYLDYEMWTGPAPMRPFCKWTHPRGWRAFMEYGNGIIGDMGVHMYDMTRWMLNLGWPKTVSSSGGILVDKASKANISDTQTATFDHGDLQVVWNHRSWGAGVDPDYPWSAIFYGDKGTLKASVWHYDFTPLGASKPTLHGEPLYEYDKYPEDRTEPGLERQCASAIRWHMKNFLSCIASRGRPVADIEQGYISTTSCILGNLSLKLGRSLAWDPAKGEVIGDAEANRLLRQPYRAPWTHPEPDKV